MRYCAALLPVLLIAAMSTATPPAVDGLRLGMTSTEVLDLLHARGQKPKGVVPLACLTDLLAMHKNVVSTEDRHGECVQEIWVRYAGGDLILWFDEAVPERPGVSVLTEIALNYPNDMNVIAMVVEQAGPPTLTDGKKPWNDAMWCFEYRCHSVDAVLHDRNSGLILDVRLGCCLVVYNSAVRSRYENAVYAALARNGIKVDNN